MQNNIPNNIEIILGKLPFEPFVSPTFSTECLDFLNEIYIEIYKDKSLNEFTDLKAFGFWCRYANQKKIAARYGHQIKSVGRGIALHICPSNVALNFAYSLAFGLLSGNQNIVRLPSRNFVQVQILVSLIKNILDGPKFSEVKDKICLIKYDRSDETSAFLSQLAQVRLLWGGDKTINQFKNYKTMPRCVDLAFSDRYSISVINPKRLSEIKRDEFNTLVRKFFYDAYLMDQHGCSSPKAVIWLAHDFDNEKERFWDNLKEFAKKNYDYDLSTASDKLAVLAETSALSGVSCRVSFDDFRVVRLAVHKQIENLDKLDCKFGSFAEVSVSCLEDIIPMVKQKFQTISYFGIEKDYLINLIINRGLIGIDRVVPIGRAFDMGPIWDGYDVIQSISRMIAD